MQLIRFAASPYQTLNISNTPAARQMLINYINDNSVIDNSFHNSWQAELSNLGYPAKEGIRVVAVSNGSECAVTQPYSPGSTLLSYNGRATTRFLSDMLLSFTPLGPITNYFCRFCYRQTSIFVRFFTWQKPN
ncbi:MAG: hypothetical protein WKG06_00700 [Segetibacter sp.]